MARISVSVALISQGSHKFYSGTMLTDLIANTCTTNPRAHDRNGFQRRLDEGRAEAIADYIRNGGTIPSSIILSAQDCADLKYNSKNRSVSFEITDKSFLILDGQHRVYGFRKLLEENLEYRIPVVIYNELTVVQEARIFIDINTLQRSVPRELLLDIRRLAEQETDSERLLDALFTDFETSKVSYLLNKLSRVERQREKISKVTFYDAMKPLIKEFDISNTAKLFRIINAYLQAVNDIAEESRFDLAANIHKPTLFKVLINHAKTVISIIYDRNPSEVEKVSEYKKYLARSLSGSFNDISASKAYTKTVESLDKKLLKRNVVI